MSAPTRVDDEPVGRDRLAGPHDDDVADLKLVDRDILLRSAGPAHARRLRTEGEQTTDRVGRVRASARLEISADENERDDRRRGLVVQVLLRLETGVREDLGHERRDDRDPVRGRGADDDERVHVRLPVPRRTPGVHIEGRRGPELHRRGEREHQVGAPGRVLEPADHEIGHRDDHRERREHGRDDETATKRHELRASRGALAVLDRGALLLIGAERQRAVTGALDRAH